MVIKTDTCYYTESKIYPGHGRQFVAKDGKFFSFLNQKARSLFFQKIKSQKLTWTQAWRRRNKKGRTDVTGKKKKVKKTAVVRAISGISVEDLKKKRTETSKMRQALNETRIRDMKQRKKKTREEKKKAKTNRRSIEKKIKERSE